MHIPTSHILCAMACIITVLILFTMTTNFLAGGDLEKASGGLSSSFSYHHFEAYLLANYDYLSFSISLPRNMGWCFQDYL